jgi:hypothetical protein
MAASTSSLQDQTRAREGRGEFPVKNEDITSGMSWAAVFAGAVVTAALSFILLALGTGIGFSSVSPWASAGASAPALGAGAVVWLILMQIIASSMGGYLAGRLRTRWVNVHTHEVYFRDTAHGFLVWAVGLVITAAFLTSAATSMVGGAARAGTMSTDGAGAQARGGSGSYFVNSLLRPSSPTSAQDNSAVIGEIGLILANALRVGEIPPADKTYLAQVVAAQTGVSEPDAEKRVDDVFAQAQQAADKARKAIAHAMYWSFLALLIGAFCASFAATIGGSQRDRVIVV